MRQDFGCDQDCDRPSLSAHPHPAAAKPLPSLPRLSWDGGASLAVEGVLLAPLCLTAIGPLGNPVAFRLFQSAAPPSRLLSMGLLSTLPKGFLTAALLPGPVCNTDTRGLLLNPRAPQLPVSL